MKTLILLFSVLFTTTSFAQVPSYVPANGLVGYWPFNGNANDESGSNHNLIPSGDASLSNDRNGLQQSAFSLSDVINNSRLEFNLQDYSLVDNFNQGSLSIWLKITFHDITNHYFGFDNMFMVRQKSGVNTQFYLGLLGGTMKLRMHLNGALPNSGDLTSNSSLSLNTWCNIVYTWDSSVEKIYINGVLDNSLNSSNSITALNSPDMFCFGSFGGVGGNSTNSILDDIGIWNRALTDCEIQNLYTSTNPSNTTTATACGSYAWNGTTYTSSGVYTDTSNCVTESLNLTITPSSTITQPASQSINISNNVQFIVGSSGSNSIYQWQTNLGFGFQNLNNAGQYNGTTSSTLSITNLSMSNNNQVFRCIISSGSCTDTSDVAVLTVVNNVGFNDLSASKLSIYPNPTNGDFTITGLELVGTVSSLTLTDMNGKVVKVLDTKATKFSMASIKPGVYFLNIISGSKQEVLKIVKE